MKEEISFAAVGDCFITRPLPQNDRFSTEISRILKMAEVRIANLEVTVHKNDVPPAKFSGGTWAIASPIVLDSLISYGFNLIGWANNHTLDYLHAGLEETKRNLEQRGFVHAGAGMNLFEASTPRYLECSSGRVALIAANSSAPDDWIAGNQSSDYLGRPGINLLRHRTIYTINHQKMDFLKTLAKTIEINFENEMRIQYGFDKAPKEEVFVFGHNYFKEGEKEGKVIEPNKIDTKRILDSINEAKRRADYVLVSIHAHEMKEKSIESPAEFLVEFARQCIDQGAHAVVGHGPHVIRGIEIYKNRPIFYSIGNFIYQPDTVANQPSDMYEKYGLKNSHNVADALDSMSANYSKGHYTIPEMWESIIPYWTMQDGQLKEIQIYPIELGFGKPVYRMGWPALTENESILKRLASLSSRYGTKIMIEKGKGILSGAS